MGYTHYWRRAPDLTPADFQRVMEDVKVILETLATKGIKLCGPTGHGEPELTPQVIAFNGCRKCGHRYRDLGKPWPSPTAAGVESTNHPVVGPWFSGALLETRVCGGCCAGEPFAVDRVFLVRDWDQQDDGRYFQSCETAYKPYDLAVTATLIRLKEHFPEQVSISSDGQEHAFEDAKRLCRQLFGWPKFFILEKEPAEVV